MKAREFNDFWIKICDSWVASSLLNWTLHWKRIWLKKLEIWYIQCIYQKMDESEFLSELPNKYD